MDNKKNWEKSKVALLLKHVEELKTLTLDAARRRRSLSQKHKIERGSVSPADQTNVLKWAELLTKQSEELISILDDNSSQRMSLLKRQDQELADLDRQFNQKG